MPDFDIQQQLDELAQQDSSNKKEDVFLEEESQIKPAQKKEPQSPKEKPLYERLEDGELDLTDSRPLKEEIKKKEFEEKINDLYSGQTSAKPASQQSASGRLTPAPQERQEELKAKIKEMDINKKEQELRNTAIASGLGYINLKGLPIVLEALRLIPEEEAKKKKAICFMFKKGFEIRLAALEKNEQIEELMKKLSQDNENTPVGFYLTSQVSLTAGLKQYAALPKIIEKVEEVKVLESDLERATGQIKDLKTLAGKIRDVSTTQIFSLILAAAIKVEASDVHLESETNRIQLRFRIDGVLHDVAQIEKEAWEHLISRIKLSSKLKINIKDKPQDGRFTVRLKEEALDFRVSTLPTAYGESVVMRILFHSKIKQMSLDNLGIEDYNQEILSKEIEKPNGLVAITGPTGSGKTTSLYAILNKLNSPDTKIITIEDPIEYKLEGINQSEVKNDRDYTFGKALRSIVRQDPDVILVGEIRDQETTEISLNAALTGHLVFTTIHTNDAAGAIPRFLSLGAKPYLLSPAVNIIVAQRLVRRICSACKQKVEVNQADKEQVKQVLEALPDVHKDKFDINLNNLVFYKGSGCDKCAGLGYKGQIGIFEMLQVIDEMREMILSSKVSETQIRQMAIKNGMITMEQDGLLKAIKGITSLEEVFRVR